MEKVGPAQESHNQGARIDIHSLEEREVQPDIRKTSPHRGWLSTGTEAKTLTLEREALLKGNTGSPEVWHCCPGSR